MSKTQDRERKVLIRKYGEKEGLRRFYEKLNPKPIVVEESKPKKSSKPRKPKEA